MNSLARQVKRRKQRPSKSHVPGHQYGSGDTAMSVEDLEWLKGGEDVKPHADFINCLMDLEANVHGRMKLIPDFLVNKQDVLSAKYHDWEVGYDIATDGCGNWQKKVLVKGPWADMYDPKTDKIKDSKEAQEYMRAIWHVFFEDNIHMGNIGYNTTEAGFFLIVQDFIPPWMLEGALQ